MSDGLTPPHWGADEIRPLTEPVLRRATEGYITRAEADRMVAEAVAREWAILTEAIETYFDATAVWDVESHAARIRARKGGAA